MQDQGTSGGLRDIFSTILKDTTTRRADPAPQRIVVHGNGNVIAPGGTVHYIQQRRRDQDDTITPPTV